uniref:Uncharacterized protein n=1 Tax=Peronospora matthiolae TaxID=2874970 RepID=A0AAV1UFC4_9STRA
MLDVTDADVLQDINELGRHKASKPNGLNDDFYEDEAALLAPALVHVRNQMLHGSNMPPYENRATFLSRGAGYFTSKKRAIRRTHLTSSRSHCYTAVTKFCEVLASQLQRALPTITGKSQQGFVRVEQMHKQDMMMTAQLASAEEGTDLSVGLSQAILLPYFRKAHDTVDRYFLYAALRSFQIDGVFITLVTRMHTGLTTRFMVNGKFLNQFLSVPGYTKSVLSHHFFSHCG